MLKPNLNGSLSQATQGVLHQGHLEIALKHIFPGERIISNEKIQTSVLNPQTGHLLEIDIWVPNLNICFEFQDEYHYSTTWYSHVSLESVQQKDGLKQSSVSQKGFSLVRVPFWWDGSVDRLAASIQFVRPDLISETFTSPIALNHYGPAESGHVPDIGELMLASFPPYLAPVSESISQDDPWWMGEKYDGIRACWNPGKKLLFTRYGNELDFPPCFFALLPSLFLDCEIWFGRGCFPESQRIVLSDQASDWPSVRFIAFDVPSIDTQIPFEMRYGLMLANVPLDRVFLTPSMRVLCTQKHHLTHMIDEIMDEGGEGLIVRKPSSLYVPGRSDALLKLKAVRGDREALVVTTNRDKSVLLQMPDGTSFTAPAPGDYSPKKGEIVSFAFDNFSRRSVPVNPRILRQRTDVSWDDLVRDFRNSSQARELNDVSVKNIRYAVKPLRYWNHERNANVRNFFEKFAKAKNLNPQDPSTWYSLALEISKQKEAKIFLSQFNRSVIKALLHVFPNIGLRETKFTTITHKFWKETKRRREVFIRYAKRTGFDPLVPDSWYRIDAERLRLFNNAKTVLGFYGGSITRTLLHLFPEIGLSSNRLSLIPGTHTRSLKGQEKVFRGFAKQLEFDPLVAANWFSPNSLVSLKSHKEMAAVLHFYKGNLKKALKSIFPDLRPHLAKFGTPKRRYWDEVGNRRKFLISFAREKGNDPNDPVFWCSVTASEFREWKASSKFVLDYYDGSFSKALLHLFPEIGLKKHLQKAASKRRGPKVNVGSTNFETESGNIAPKAPAGVEHVQKSVAPGILSTIPKELFMSYAQEKGFDPLVHTNWYSVNFTELADRKGSTETLAEHTTYVKALFHVFPNVGLVRSRFSSKLPSKYWAAPTNQRKFMISFAKEKGFDPLLPANWYNVSTGSFLAARGASTVMAYYNNNFSATVANLFPEIGVDILEFSRKLPTGYWTDLENQRHFFRSFAKAKGFDPLIPSNWYPVTSEDILEVKGASNLLVQYNGSFVRALYSLFPELKFERHKFLNIPRNHWRDEKNRRNFFVRYAEKKKFDPLIAENWYSVIPESVINEKKICSLLKYHENDLGKALVYLFPEIGLDIVKFTSKHM
eukprot:Phypoly_transcript_00400.p1 GENE.Phypoly_transcript_00400~~Phypoly_transcript_00400.p1  ORF type:complete len:1105 (+),score=129.94 Phypoly_transcript_00400:31-3345(+)